MFEEAINILSILEQNGYKAYIVGGFVRDKYLNIKSNDIDICTTATPKDINKIFENVKIIEKYYATKVVINNYCFDVSSLRKEYFIFNKTFIKYTDNIRKDLNRRDFTINSLYMDKKMNIIDLISGTKDIDNKVIKTVGNPKNKIKQDPLRILRAIKYASKLNFRLDNDLFYAIKNKKYLLKNISFDRKKKELSEIFSNKNYNVALDFINDLGLKKILEIEYKEVNWCSNYLGMWAQINYSSNYNFSKKELLIIEAIKKIINHEIDNYTVYKYGIEINEYCAEILKFPKKNVMKIYKNLQIMDKKEIKYNYLEICDILDLDVCDKSKKVYNELEKEIVYNRLLNKKSFIKKFVIEKIKETNNE